MLKLSEHYKKSNEKLDKDMKWLQKDYKKNKN